jgi:VanZ family protein
VPGGSGVRWASPAFAAVVVLSLYVLFWPSPADGGVTLPGADKLVHAGLFLLLALTARLRFGGAAVVLVAVLGYAALSELVQAGLLSRRSGDLLDLLADSAGALLGWQLARRLLLRTPARRPGPRRAA